MRNKHELDDGAQRHKVYKAEMRVLLRDLKKRTERLLRIAQAREKQLRSRRVKTGRKRKSN